MEYQLSEDFIRLRKSEPRKIVVFNLVFVGFIGAAMFFIAGNGPYHPLLVIIFGAMLLATACISFFQARSARRRLDHLHLQKVRIRIGEDGLSIVDPDTTQIYRYESIKSVVVFRRRSGGPIRRIILETGIGKISLPGLIDYEAFVAELRTRLGAVPFAERKG